MSNSDLYWRKTQRLTISLLLLWFGLTFVMSWYAGELNRIVFFGFPLGFYMGAQGVPVVYLAIIWFYNRKMRKLDAEFEIDDE